MDDPAQTSATLLDRLRDGGDDDAWERFAAFYQPVIYRYARRCGCSDGMGWDIVQETLVDLLSIMPRFHYDRSKGRFRSFLYRVVRNRTLCAYRREKRYVTGSAGGISVDGMVDEASDADAMAARWEEEWQRQLLTTALQELQVHSKPGTFVLFEAYVIRGRSVDAVCEEFGIPANALYQIRYRLIEKLKHIVDQLEGDLENSYG